MDDHEKIQSFGDMVGATESLTKPWRRALYAAIAVIAITNLIWGIVVYSIQKKPVVFYQSQNFPEQTQNQEYLYGNDAVRPTATHGTGE